MNAADGHVPEEEGADEGDNPGSSDEEGADQSPAKKARRTVPSPAPAAAAAGSSDTAAPAPMLPRHLNLSPEGKAETKGKRKKRAQPRVKRVQLKGIMYSLIFSMLISGDNYDWANVPPVLKALLEARAIINHA